MYDVESIKDLIFLAYVTERSVSRSVVEVSITRLVPQEVIQRYDHYRI